MRRGPQGADSTGPTSMPKDRKENARGQTHSPNSASCPRVPSGELDRKRSEGRHRSDGSSWERNMYFPRVYKNPFPRGPVFKGSADV